MAESKFIVIFVLICSLLITILSTQICGVFDTATDAGIISDLFTLTTFTDAQATCTVGQENTIANGEASITEGFVNATSGLATPSAGATGSFGTSTFIDVIKLIGGLIGFLLGIPVYTFFFVIGLQQYVAITIAVFLFTMYIIGWMEFIRGGSL